MDGWMKGWLNEQMERDGETREQMKAYVNEQMDEHAEPFAKAPHLIDLAYAHGCACSLCTPALQGQ